MKVKSKCCEHIQQYDHEDPDTMLCEKCLIGNVFEEVEN